MPWAAALCTTWRWPCTSAARHVTGSDDEIFEPARARLAAAGLLPPHEGWDAARITPDLDGRDCGHARPPRQPRAARGPRSWG
ncbi:MAG: hypothetical protein WKG07_33185 [Hymenobacter sp.]